MSDRAPSSSSPRPRRQRRTPLELDLTVVVRFGDEPEDKVVLVQERQLKMLGSVFIYRDKIARFLATGLLRAAMLQPRIARKVLPLVNLRKRAQD